MTTLGSTGHMQHGYNKGTASMSMIFLTHTHTPA
jgi:hypothetical protein